MKNMRRQKVKLWDMALMAVCIVLVPDSIAPSAAIGVTSIFWWLLLLITFFYPYGLITAELGTTYREDGGIYGWIKRAYGKTWGARIAFYYWVNYVFWVASTSILFALFVEKMIGITFSPITISLISLIVIWICFLFSFSKISDDIWLLKIGAVSKAFILLSVGFIGTYIALTKGTANDFSWKNLTPSFNSGMKFLPMILFNFVGFEVIAAVSSEMENPQKNIPKILMIGGILIAFFYLFSTFGMLVAIPVEHLSTSIGIIESLDVLLADTKIASYFLVFSGILFLNTLIANLVSWAVGVNYVAMCAAEQNDLPKIFAKKYKHTQLPLGSALMNAIFATIMIGVYYLFTLLHIDKDEFWNFFSLSSITLLISYLMLFPSFRKLRKIDPDRKRPFKIEGGNLKIFLISYMPTALIIASLILFFYVPGIPFDKQYFYQVGGILFITILTSEIIIKRLHKNPPKQKLKNA